MSLHPDYKDILVEFAKQEVEYLVVGGYAVGFHGTPRHTKDLDLWINPSSKNLARVRVSLAEFGAPAALVSELDTATVDDVLWMGVPPVRIDFLKGVPGGNFSACYSRRVDTRWDETPVAIVGREDLVVLKRASCAHFASLEDALVRVGEALAAWRQARGIAEATRAFAIDVGPRRVPLPRPSPPGARLRTRPRW